MKSAGKMMKLKSDLEELAQTLKNIERDFDESLQGSAEKVSCLIQFNYSLREILFTCRVLKEYVEAGKTQEAGVLIDEVAQQMRSLQNLLAREIQKSMLKITEAMAHTEGVLLLMTSIDRLKRDFEEIPWEVAR